MVRTKHPETVLGKGEMMSRREAQKRCCSFCGRPHAEVRKLVSGPNVFICDRCIKVCRETLAEDRKIGGPSHNLPKPREISRRFDEWVIGQERAKRTLAVAVYNHLKRISRRDCADEVELSKGNILLIGPTGCGKTHLAWMLARMLDVPFAIADATPLTQAGYVGEDVESIIAKLLQAAGNDLKKAATGIVYLDEVDKLVKRAGHDRDVRGEGVQQALLKILEGKKTVLRMGDRNGLVTNTVEVDTTDILFIAGGAFQGLAKMMARKEQASSGFRPGGLDVRAAAEGLHRVTPSDLQRYGFIPEFIGRFHVIVTLDDLDERQLVSILTQPRDALLRQYQKLFAIEGARLEATDDGLAAIARRAIRRGTGARALRAVLEELLTDVMFDLPSRRGSVYRLDQEAVDADQARLVPGGRISAG